MGLKNCGGLWLRQGKKGKFMSGSFEPEGRGGKKYEFLVFKNDQKEGKQPDYRIVMSDGQDDDRRPSKDDPEDAPF